MGRLNRRQRFSDSEVKASESKNHTVKSQLAKLLATENISIMHDPLAHTAAFDVKNRVLVLPVWQDISNDLYDLLVVHEVGHALDTPADGWKEATEKLAEKYYPGALKTGQHVFRQFLNVIEDCRIDKRQKRRYPGSKKNYAFGFKELHDRDFFQIENVDVNSLSFIDRINLFFKGGTSLNIQFSKEEQEFIDEIYDLERWSEVCDLTERLFQFCKAKNDLQNAQESDIIEETVNVIVENGEKGDGESKSANGVTVTLEMQDQNEGSQKGQAQDDQEQDGQNGEGQGQNGEGDQEGQEGKGQGQNGEGDQEDQEGKGQGQDDQDGEGLAKGQSGRGSGLHIKVQVDELHSRTEKAHQENLKNLIYTDDFVGYINLTLPIFNSSVFTDDYKTVLAQMQQSYNLSRQSPNKRLSGWTSQPADLSMDGLRAMNMKIKDSEKNVVSFMAKEFEMRKSADAYSKIAIAKTGVLNTNKLHSYKFNDDIFRKNTVVPEGKNHGVILLLDWSGSMRVQLKETLIQLYSLVLFCKKVQIPFEVYTFITDLSRSSKYHGASYNSSPLSSLEVANKSVSDIEFGKFRLRNIISSRMTITELNEMIGYLLYSVHYELGSDQLYSTPFNQALLALDPIVNEFRKKNKIQIMNVIVLTDGLSDPAQISGETRRKLDSRSYLDYKSSYNINLLDPVTKENIIISTNSPTSPTYLGEYKFTEACLKTLKARTGANVLGFGLANNYSAMQYMTSNQSTQEYMSTNKEFKEQGFCSLTASGFDEFYLVNVSKLTNSVSNLHVKSGMSKKNILKNFMSFSEKKSVNRVLLKRFVDRINTVNM